jgi:hypothetical protein
MEDIFKKLKLSETIFTKKVLGTILFIIVFMLYYEKVVNGIIMLSLILVAVVNIKQKNKHNSFMILLLFLFTYALDVIENLIYYNVIRKIIPFYFLVKIILYVYLMFPHFQGMNIIYNRILFYLLLNNDKDNSCLTKITTYIQEQETKYNSIKE